MKDNMMILATITAVMGLISVILRNINYEVALLIALFSAIPLLILIVFRITKMENDIVKNDIVKFDDVSYKL